MPRESTEPSPTGLSMSAVVGTGVSMVGNLGSLADLCALCGGKHFQLSQCSNQSTVQKERKKNWGDGVDGGCSVEVMAGCSLE